MPKNWKKKFQRKNENTFVRAVVLVPIDLIVRYNCIDHKVQN